jgi:segregation and condensation protein B
MELIRIKSLLESLIFVSEIPLKAQEMLKALQDFERFEAMGEAGETGETTDEGKDAAEQLESKAAEEESKISLTDVKAALQELVEEIAQNPGRGIALVEVAGGWQFRTKPQNAAAIRNFYQTKPTRLSKPSLETLSIVAYRQPITRAEIDEIRGVESGGVLKTLCEKNLVRIVGKKDEPGKPLLYGSTQDFLELFQLKGLKDLPTLRDYRELEEEYRKKSGEEGVITVNEAEAQESSLTDLVSESMLAPLNEEEEEILVDLEENIKGVRNLEKEIFAKDEKEQDPPPADDAPKGAHYGTNESQNN